MVREFRVRCDPLRAGAWLPAGAPRGRYSRGPSGACGAHHRSLGAGDDLLDGPGRFRHPAARLRHPAWLARALVFGFLPQARRVLGAARPGSALLRGRHPERDLLDRLRARSADDGRSVRGPRSPACTEPGALRRARCGFDDVPLRYAACPQTRRCLEYAGDRVGPHAIGGDLDRSRTISGRHGGRPAVDA